MIKNVIIYKSGGLTIRFDNGLLRSYPKRKMPESALNFILREDVKGYENNQFIKYEKCEKKGD